MWGIVGVQGSVSKDLMVEDLLEFLQDYVVYMVLKVHKEEFQDIMQDYKVGILLISRA